MVRIKLHVILIETALINCTQHEVSPLIPGIIRNLYYFFILIINKNHREQQMFHIVHKYIYLLTLLIAVKQTFSNRNCSPRAL